MTTVIIPTYNAGKQLAKLLESLKAQSLACDVLVIDASSSDDTANIAKRAGATVTIIEKKSFDHGGTRTLAGTLTDADILIYMTQDALPADCTALENLIKPFSDPMVAAAYGRQLPHPGASPFGGHLRLFNYPEISHIRSLTDKTVCGIRTPFLSNSFAAYRKTALEEIGWFRERLIMGEDTWAGAKLLLAGYRLAYVSEAKVFHSHDYSPPEDFRRYFDIGVFHRCEDWILSEFGGAGGEGTAYVKSAIMYLAEQKKSYLLPELMVRTALKLAGYSLGRMHTHIPVSLKKKLSMHRDWWDKSFYRSDQV
jgi:rhamnosyltransferase